MVDSSFVRRAVELADLNAVRVALYAQTGDPELAALPVAALLDQAQRERLVSRAVRWLEQHAGPGMPPEPPEPELRRLMNMATGGEMGDLEFEARRDLPAFGEFPLMARWGAQRPEIPGDFLVAVIGSGFSGLAMAVQLQLLGIPYVVLERRAEPGGTWTINRYPDVRVDTISITYEFLFEKNYPWTEYFARGPEVRDYLRHVADKYGVREHIRFGRDVRSARFDESAHRWQLDVSGPEGPEKLTASVIVNAMGLFASPKHPHFPGASEFQGTVVHPARWPDGLDVRGKRVAVVGNGSTGVQLLAPIAREAEQVFVLQRTPQWISPRDKYGKGIEPEVRWLLDNFPGYWNWWRYMAIAALFETHRFFIPDVAWKAGGGLFNPLSDKLRADLTAYIENQTGGEWALIEKLIPEYAPFSRRPVVDNGWYQALTRDNVELVTDRIRRLVPTGFETADGTVRNVDIIVTATGFEVAKYLWPTSYTGRDGIGLHDFWSADGPRAYLGMLVPFFPNMFTLYGPNSQPVSGGTGLPVWFVLWAAYAAQAMVRMLEESKSLVEVKLDAYLRYNEELDGESKQLILLQPEGAPEKNYYVNEFGRVQVNAPWYGPDFHQRCARVDWNDVDLS
jgi:4-hydroxyacetophenone monooxygenase